MGKINAIPQSLRESGLFCCWRHETKNGRQTKIPYSPVTGQRAQTNNSGTFADCPNMFDAVAVQRMAYENDFFELVLFIEEQKQEYCEFILHGTRD